MRVLLLISLMVFAVGCADRAGRLTALQNLKGPPVNLADCLDRVDEYYENSFEADVVDGVFSVFTTPLRDRAGARERDTAACHAEYGETIEVSQRSLSSDSSSNALTKEQVSIITSASAPRSLQECLNNVRFRPPPNPNSNLGQTLENLTWRIGRDVEEQECYSNFGRHRRDEIDRSVATEKVQPWIDEPVYNDLSGYEKSRIHGAAHSAVKDYDYGNAGCQMSGGLYSAC